MEQPFFVKKPGSWIGYVGILIIAVIQGYMLAKSPFLGLGLFSGIFGLAVILVSLLHAEIGFYINIVYCFFAYGLSRFFFNDEFPVGIVTDVLILATLFSFFIKGVELRTSFDQFFRNPIALWTVIVYFYLSIEFLNPYGHSTEMTTQVVRKSLENIILLFISFHIFNSRAAFRRYFIALFVLCAIVGIYGCIQQWHGLFNYERTWAMSDETRFGLLFIDGDFRKFSTMNDPTAYSIIMSSCSALFIVIAMYQKKKRTKRLLLLGSVFMLLGMAYSGTRTANVMVISAFAMYILLTIYKRRTWIFTLIAVFVFLVLMYGPFGGNSTVNRFRSSFAGSQDGSFNVREISRAYIQPYIYSHPIGGGLGTTGLHGALFTPGHVLAGFQTDSGYLKDALECGWIGLLLICILYFTILREGIRGYFRSANEDVKIVYAAATSAIFAFYIGEFAQDAIGQITDLVVYYPIVAIIMKLKYYDDPVLAGAIA